MSLTILWTVLEHAGHYSSMALRLGLLIRAPNPTEAESNLGLVYQTNASDDIRCRLNRVYGNAEAALWQCLAYRVSVDIEKSKKNARKLSSKNTVSQFLRMPFIQQTPLILPLTLTMFPQNTTLVTHPLSSALVENKIKILLGHEALQLPPCHEQNVPQPELLEHLAREHQARVFVQRDGRLVHPGSEVDGARLVREGLVREESFGVVGQVGVWAREGVVELCA
jgi:hypothetical protein